MSINTVKFGSDESHLLQADVLEEGPFGSSLELKRNGKTVTIQTRLGGPFAPRNIAFAANIVSVYDVSLNAIRRAVEEFESIAGRFEIISRRPLVIVDYAHTINALSILLPYVRAHTSGKLIHVFGGVGGNIEANFGHDLNRQRMHVPRWL